MKKSDKNSIDPKIGANLKKIMEWENLSGKALAETVGINPVTVSKYLTQKINMRETTARHICGNCSSENRHYRHEWLLGYDDFPTEEELVEIYKIKDICGINKNDSFFWSSSKPSHISKP